MGIWDVSFYTGYNRTAKENELMMRRLVDQILAVPLGSTQPIDVPVGQVPFMLVLWMKTIYKQGVSKSNQTLDASSGRYSLMLGKSFSLIRGYKTVRVLKTVNANETHQTLLVVSEMCSHLVGSIKHGICVTNTDIGASKCGSIILPPATVASLIPDKQKNADGYTTSPSCRHPDSLAIIYSLMDIDIQNFYCSPSPEAIAEILAFHNWMVVTAIPDVSDQSNLAAGTFAPTGFRLPVKSTGFMDATPNTTGLMLPLVQYTTGRRNGVILRILLTTSVASAIFTAGQTIETSFALCLNTLFEDTNNSSFDATVAITLVATYWTYRDVILAMMIVRQLIAPLPWNVLTKHTYADDLVFVPAPSCYIFVVGMCLAKHVLHSFRICVRLAYVAM
ncbi:hypothetical protein AC1031_009208 [Aphanomyces cochlioides]|nr:hypothetical protein AC1031_009208 [Aphanomyces cochlioides]